ncbi:MULTISPECIES: cyclic nucleotide-binding domain-containing protein [Spirulina sp. CCY15215]|uniref:cyclic nucleotide-binding domain-containing protein n=1 Tax=Spirulina sp. CCY15215 TaxID=2767591 RepID=UPI00195235E7|nr:cyclic nucleotide-binding domain-containing protein [Spirulina major]
MRSFVELFYHRLKNIFETPFFGTESDLSLGSIFQLLLASIVVFFCVRLFRRLLKAKLLKPLKLDASNREAIATLISYGFGCLAFVILLQGVGFKFESLAVIVGSFGVGIGFGLQDFTKNSVSGLTLLLERKVKVGDFIEFDHLSGYVKTISLRSMVIRTREGGDVIVPNSQLVENRVLNWNYEDALGRIHIPIGVAYDSDPVLVTEALLNAAYNEPNVLHDPSPHVLFRNFGDHALNFELRVWVRGYDREPYVKSTLNFLIEDSLRHQGINVPFPQQDLWLRNPEVLSPIIHPSRSLRSAGDEMRSPPPSSPKALSIRDLLKQVVYFQGFTDLELRELIEIGYRKRLRQEDVLFREGDPGDAFYIILSGSVDVYAQKIDKHLATLETGKFFGELALMLGIPRTATVIAKKDTILFVINNSGFKRLLRENLELAENIVKELSKHQQELSERRKQLQDMGLDEKDDNNNVVDWVRNRVKKLFSL